MKRILIAVFSMIILLGTASTTLAERNLKTAVTVDGKMMSLDKVNVQVDGEGVETDVPAVNLNGRALVPVRFVSEKLGAEVGWDKQTDEAIIKTSDKEIRLKINSSKITINGKEQSIPYDTPAKFMSTSLSDGSRTMVPLRFVSETLGAEVNWIDETFTADIKSKSQVKPEEKPEVKPEPKPEVKPEIKANKIKSITTKNVENSTIPQIHIEADGELNYKAILENPTRLVIDIERALVEKEINLNVDNAVVSSIKASQIINDITDKTVRVIVELKKPVEYQVGKEKNSLNVSFINQIQGIDKETINGREAIVIKNVYASKTNSFFLSNPDRLVLDIRNTILTSEICLIKTDIVKELRLGQYKGKEYDESEKVARVVLDINENYENPKLTSEIRGNDLIIYVDGNKKTVVTPPVVTPKPPVVTPPTTPPVKPPASGNGKVIVIDAGHGGSDGGAGAANGMQEKNLALNVALKTRDKLESLGYKVIMSRTGDTYPSLSARYKLANDNNADAFLSIHFNAATPSATGIETLYSTKNYKNQAFAQSIQDELIKNLKPVDRGLKLRNNLAVLNGAKCISALAELGFISNPNDIKKIATEDYLDKCAQSIANGIHNFLSK